jgi:sortase (surface protein transpeptidase)
MTRRPLFVGALVALVGVVLVLLWVQRGADDVSQAAPLPTASVSPTSTPTTMTQTPTPTTTPTTTALPSTAEPPSSPATPVVTGVDLRIPGIGLRASLHAEGLRDGKINPPAGTVMWFTGLDRVAPGGVGTSVIAGHVVAGGRPDVFADLAEVGVGDEVQIVGTDGDVERFRVVRAGVVDKDELTVDQSVWGGNTSVRRLAIITCDDAYGFRGDGHRVANYVVIAEPA